MIPLPENIHRNPELDDRVQVFADRRQAGAALAEMLGSFRDSNAMLLAVPAGGVPVALALRELVRLDLELLLVSKMTLPWNTEAGFGALAWDGTMELNELLVRHLHLSSRDIEDGTRKTSSKLSRRLHLLRGGRPFPDLSNRAAIVADDGLASGYTLRVAVRSAQKAGASPIYVAVPTAHAEAACALASEVADVYCPNLRSGPRFAVADAYRRWFDVSETDLVKLLSKPGMLPDRPKPSTSG
jgi:putative phosphoribosyl transferase